MTMFVCALGVVSLLIGWAIGFCQGYFVGRDKGVDWATNRMRERLCK